MEEDMEGSLEEDLEVGRLFVREQSVVATVEDMVAIREVT